MNIFSKRVEHSIVSYQAAWKSYIKRNAPDLLQVINNNPIYSMDCLDFLALSWAKEGFCLHRGMDAVSPFTRDVGPVINSLYEPYLASFKSHLETFNMREVPRMLDMGDKVDPFEVDPRESTCRVLKFMPHACAEIDIIQRVGKNLMDILTRRISFMEAVSPNNDASMLEALYYNSSSSILPNIVFAGIFEAISQVKNRPLKVLEIGAGTGGTTASIIHLIPKYCYEYWFTDVSHVFLSAAKRRFKEETFLYQILDLEDRTAFEAIADKSFDVVIASNAVHNACSLLNALSNINLILADGGLLLLSEMNRIPIWTEFIFGAAPEWWKVTNDTNRSNGPLASTEQWRALIGKAIGKSFIAINNKYLPMLNKHYLQNFPSVIVALRDKTLHTAMNSTVVVLPSVSQQSSVVKRTSILVRTTSDLRIDRLQISERIRFDREIMILADEKNSLPNHFADIGDQPVDFCILLNYKTMLDAFLNGVSPGESLLKEWFAVLDFVRGILTHSNIGYTISLVTVGGQAVGGNVPNPLLFGLQGIFLTIANEYPMANIRSFDVDSTLNAKEITFSIERFLKRPYRREEIADRSGKLFYPVLTRTSLIPSKMHLAPMPRSQSSHANQQGVPSFEVRIGGTREFNDLVFINQAIRKLGPDDVEIEVHYAALNYRDVIKVLGEYPFDGGDYMDLGDECSGIVVAIGERVDPSLIGRHVMVIGERLLASRVIVHKRQVIPILSSLHLGLNEAATIPVAYLTAHYALISIGQLQRGERVLIHSAAGGVGLAAIKVAKACGAVVFATASLPKQDIVRYWGADYIYNSRSLDFERQILEDTAGEGIDVVLNSLSGDYQTASLKLLRNFGRFIELGKRDVYQSRILNQYDLRQNISFHVVDMSKLSKGASDRWKVLISDIEQRLEEGSYLPLPFRVYRAAHVGHALKTMATGRHLGKILVSMRDTAVIPVEQPITRTGAYETKTVIITGGISGLGFEVAKSFCSGRCR